MLLVSSQIYIKQLAIPARFRVLYPSVFSIDSHMPILAVAFVTIGYLFGKQLCQFHDQQRYLDNEIAEANRLSEPGAYLQWLSK